MSTEIRQVGTDALPGYSEVRSSLVVESVFRLEPVESGLGGIRLREEKISSPYVKDYDAARGEGPTRWLKKWDLSEWGIFMAFQDGWHIGGSIVAPGAHIGDLDSRFSQLFDIRLLPEHRRQGNGSMLLKRAAEWAKQRGCSYLKIETQNTNVPACRFYAGQGCVLGNIDKCAYIAYPEAEHETRLIWYLDL